MTAWATCLEATQPLIPSDPTINYQSGGTAPHLSTSPIQENNDMSNFTVEGNAEENSGDKNSKFGYGPVYDVCISLAFLILFIIGTVIKVD